MKEKQLDGNDVVQSLVEKIPEEILRRTMVRKNKVTFNEEAEHLGLGHESGEWATSEEDAEYDIRPECAKMQSLQNSNF